MENNDELRELYIKSFDKVCASDELLRKVETMSIENEKSKKVILRRVLIAAAAVISLFVLSNVVTFAATGEAWVARFIWEAEPNQPADNVQHFFDVNAGIFGEEYGGNAAENYYGGTYLDGGTQVILLTDLSKSEEFTDIPENVRFEKCDYTYAELGNEIKNINAELTRLRAQGEAYAADVASWGLNNMENRLWVDIYEMTDEKVEWFKENISDAPYLVFNNTDSFFAEDLETLIE